MIPDIEWPIEDISVFSYLLWFQKKRGVTRQELRSGNQCWFSFNPVGQIGLISKAVLLVSDQE